MAALVIPVGAVVVLLRVGAGGFRGVVWAEDGAVFLNDAYARGAWQSLFSPYAGYLHVTARTIVASVSHLPIAWHGLALNISAALVQACVAYFAMHVVRANTHGLFAPVFATLSVLLVPLGAETAANVANLQWFLLFAGGIAPLWSPRRWPGRLTAALFVLAATTSCPFGGIAVVVALVVWWVQKSRFALVLGLVGLMGTVVQAIAMTHAPPRTTPIKHSVDPLGLVHGFVVRVTGDGVFGAHFHDQTAPSGAVWTGLAVLAAVSVLAMLGSRRGGREALFVPAVLVVESFVTFAAPVVTSGIDWRIPIESPRYYVAPSLFLACAAAVMVGRIGGGAPALRSAHRVAVAASAVVLVCFGIGWVTSYHDPSVLRGASPSWSSEVHRARSRCANHPQRFRAQSPRVRIAPEGWAVSVPCARLLR